MPKETAEQFAIDIIGYAYDWVVSDTELAKLIRARDRETAEEMRERAAQVCDKMLSAMWSEEYNTGDYTLPNDYKHPVEAIRALPLDPPAETPKPKLARHQPCGCVLCVCEDDVQCHGCGAKHCGTHPVSQFPPAETGSDKAVDELCRLCGGSGEKLFEWTPCPDCRGTGLRAQK